MRRASAVTGPARLAVVLPVLVGVLAMHVLLLCIGSGTGSHDTAAGHGGHSVVQPVAHEPVSSLPPSAIPVTGMPAWAHPAGVDAAATVATVAGLAAGAVDGHLFALACLGIAVTVGLLVRRRPTGSVPLVEASGGVVVRSPRSDPGPARAPRLAVLCVLRT